MIYDLKSINPQISAFPKAEIKGIHFLEELALNLLCTWNHGADIIWKQLDPALWALTNNPWVVLQTVSGEKLKSLLENPEFFKLVEEMAEKKRQEVNSPGWFQQSYPKTSLSHAVYFSMEYMLSEALPIYSGGLGNVAGDQLKSSSDLGVPVTAIGLLYQEGYFRQAIDKDGAQKALYPFNDPGQLPVIPLRKPNGEWLRLEIALPGWSLYLRTWQVNVGRVKLYLLDSNDAANMPIHRGITSELYGGDSELRLKQELVLGIGGWRLLEALGIKPEVAHLNEGHAAFAILERASSFMNENECSFEEALAATRAGNLFTTHTAVPAGFDRFSPALIEQYLKRYAEKYLKISLQELLALGRQNPDNPEEDFNMAYLAIRGSGAVNGVSKLHGKVSRSIFQSLFPRWPEDEVPIGYVTNGVHMPSWDSAESDKLWTEACGKDRWLHETERLGKEVSSIPNEKIWSMRNESRTNLVLFSRERLKKILQARGASHEEIEIAKTVFDPNALTLGFARRFATYKRPNMLLHDPGRLLRILANPDRPVQLIIAGKAHPADKPGRDLIQQWIRFIRQPEVRKHIVFLSDYDMLLTEHLVQGVDVWLNTPRRPWEACGTSGMKVLVNGGLNLSELDGWWAEAYTPEVGWALGDGEEHGDDPAWDASEAEKLYDLLEKQVVPEFYQRNEEGQPSVWLDRIRNSMAQLTPKYSANRSVRQYTEEYYLPMAERYLLRAANKGEVGKKILDWQKTLKQKWGSLRFTDVQVSSDGYGHSFKIEVYLDDLNPNDVKVQLYSNEFMGDVQPHPEKSNTYIYQATVPARLPAKDYTPRLVPSFPGAAIPLEANEILWQK